MSTSAFHLKTREEIASRLEKVVARFRSGEDVNPVSLARRFGLSHTTIRAELRRLGLIAPQKSRKGKT